MWHSLQFGVCQDCAKNDSWLSSRKPRLAKVPISFKKNGAPDRIRTCDLCLRRAALYPAELRARERCSSARPPGRANRGPKDLSRLARNDDIPPARARDKEKRCRRVSSRPASATG